MVVVKDNNIYNNEKKKIIEALTINLAQWCECDVNVYLCQYVLLHKNKQILQNKRLVSCFFGC